jgi:hypothetical protein
MHIRDKNMTKKIVEAISKVPCLSDIDTPFGTDYIVKVKLKVVFSKYKHNSGQNYKQESKGG